MTTEAKTKEAFIIRDFKDATNEQHFSGNTIEPIEAGRFINFEAAGLVRVPTDEDRAAVKGGKATKAA